MVAGHQSTRDMPRGHGKKPMKRGKAPVTSNNRLIKLFSSLENTIQEI